MQTVLEKFNDEIDSWVPPEPVTPAANVAEDYPLEKLVAALWAKPKPDEYNAWAADVIALRNTDPNLKWLAEKYSRRSHTFTQKRFDDLWNSVNRRDNPRTWRSILFNTETESTALTFAEFSELYSTPLEVLIEELLHRGEVMNVVAPTKLGKSYFVMYLLLCVLTGRPWFGRATTPGRVLLVDNELQKYTIRKRLLSLMDKMELTGEERALVHQNLEIDSLRGRLEGIKTVVARIMAKPTRTYDLVVFDALYRMSEGEENTNEDVTKVYNLADHLAQEHGCSVLVVHHCSKGNQVNKAVTDVGSGAGAQSRAADVHLVLRPTKNPDCVIMDAAVRDYRGIHDVVLERDFPIWKVTDKDPEDATPTVEDILEGIEPGEYGKTELVAQLKKTLGATKNAVEYAIHTAVESGYFETFSGPHNKAMVRVSAEISVDEFVAWLPQGKSNIKNIIAALKDKGILETVADRVIKRAASDRYITLNKTTLEKIEQ